jgi:hypothetical protein
MTKTNNRQPINLMPSLNDLRPQGDRHPKAEQPSESLQFTRQQAFLSEHRYKLLSCDTQLGQLEDQRRALLRHLLGRSHIASWDELFPMVETVRRAVPPANLACVFGICADGTTLAKTNIKPFSALFFDSFWTLSVHIQFTGLAQADQVAALRWHAQCARHFDTPPGAPVAEILAEVRQRQDSLESSVLSRFLWLHADAVSFFPEAGKPEKGWAEACAFFRAYQRLSVEVREQLNPCQLLIACLRPVPPAK